MKIEKDNGQNGPKLDKHFKSRGYFPFEVQKMVFLISAGNGIYLSLRNNDDKTVERIQATRLYDVLGEDAAEAKTYFAEQMAKDTKRTSAGGR